MAFGDESYCIAAVFAYDFRCGGGVDRVVVVGGVFRLDVLPCNLMGFALGFVDPVLFSEGLYSRSGNGESFLGLTGFLFQASFTSRADIRSSNQVAKRSRCSMVPNLPRIVTGFPARRQKWRQANKIK